MPTYTVNKRPFQKKTFTGSRNGKEMAVWEMELKDEEGMFTMVEMVQLVTTPAPEEGATLEGTIDSSGPFGAKFNKAKAAYGGSNGGGGGYGKSPEERAEIRRSVAVKAAVELLGIEVGSGMIPQERLAGAKASELLQARIQFLDDALKVQP